MRELPEAGAPGPADAVGRALGAAARTSAVLGGLVLAALMTMVLVSIVGRALAGLAGAVPALAFAGPVPGDFELVEMGSALAIAAFLPLCQMRRGHVLVDIAFRNAGPRGRAAFEAMADLGFALLGGLLVWQLLEGARERVLYQETTMVLRLPLWWGYAGVAVFFALAVACALYMACAGLARLRAEQGAP